jgi:glutamine synthetase
MTLDGVRYKAGDNVFFNPKANTTSENPLERLYFSKTAQSYIAGLLKYMDVILRMTNPGENSYRRIVPQAEAPTNEVVGVTNRSAAIRIPFVDNRNPNAKRVEDRVADPYGPVYPKFCLQLMAGLKGIDEKLKLPLSLVVEETDVWAMSDQEKTELGIKELPGGPGGLEKAIALMNQRPAEGAAGKEAQELADKARFIDELIYPPGLLLREFFSKPHEIIERPLPLVGPARLDLMPKPAEAALAAV